MSMRAKPFVAAWTDKGFAFRLLEVIQGQVEEKSTVSALYMDMHNHNPVQIHCYLTQHPECPIIFTQPENDIIPILYHSNTLDEFKAVIKCAQYTIS